MKISKILFALAGLIGTNTSNAQDKSSDTTAKYFIIQASIGNLQEASLGKLAKEHAVSQEVKAFASRMVADHGNAQTKLMQLIQQKNFQIPAEATGTPVEDLMLKNMRGQDFDRLYVHMMLPDHRQTVALFEKYALTGKDPVVKAFAAQTLPTLKEHLAAIIAIDESMTAASIK